MKPDTFKGARLFCFLVWEMLFYRSISPRKSDRIRWWLGVPMGVRNRRIGGIGNSANSSPFSGAVSDAEHQ